MRHRVFDGPFAEILKIFSALFLSDCAGIGPRPVRSA